MTLKRFCILVLSLLFPATAIAADWYIDPDGNDTTGDGSVGAPWATLYKATVTAGAGLSTGDTIYLGDGTYTDAQSITIGSATLDNKVLSIKPNPANTGTITYTVTNTSIAIYYNGIFTAGSVTFDGPVTISQTGATLTNYFRSTASGTHAIRFNDWTFTSTGENRNFLNNASSASGPTYRFDRCTFKNGSATAISCDVSAALAAWDMYDCVVEGGQASWFRANQVVGRLTADGCTLSGSSYATLNCFLSWFTNGVITNLILTENAVTGNSGLCYMPSGVTSAVIERNTVIVNSAVTQYGILVGIDAATGGANLGRVRIRDNYVEHTGSTRGHGILLGHGVTGGEVAYNTITGGDWNLVVKASGSWIHDNTITDKIAGSTDGCIILRVGDYNSFTNNYLYSAEGYCLAADGQSPTSDTPDYNIFMDNICVQGAANTSAIFADFRGSDDGNMDTWQIDRNKLFPASGGHLALLNIGGGTNYDTLATLQAAWATYGDVCRANDMYTTLPHAVFHGNRQYIGTSGVHAR